jgi:nitrile hydratase
MSEQGTYKPLTYFQLMEVSLRELLVEKGVLTQAQIEEAVEDMRNRTPERGARVVARAWVDAEFKKRLLADGPGACESLGIDVPKLRLVVVENTPQVHNAIVCTLCSCYPRAILGLPPSWYKSREYRARAVREPRAVLREFGTSIPDSIDESCPAVPSWKLRATITSASGISAAAAATALADSPPSVNCTCG